ncbi:Magnesium transport protein CorA [Galdieria sulphuraria]|uniref:Metal ion (Mn2+/Co2+) transporter, MIT family isoform 1 n=1 Tax=Galdieria sulphuraria TaxID=130081 RepID=M2X0G1_GALSU|nr:metal ion (Mn2+/Co2+) transporter, MIT family isoform 2 [Galdieria sulphuraria]XP_005706340.1 metal ion (Mn2+/Co2+) transporter, MIT family isoform 1 [Galdieria sulphuraria]EME29819.1 metal ion (Mn2+/Co2+) transporter, MIT family isoform 2 [Galdieria sulphuraria]EME29820.1 metal ion (Mn2+/Co2+) transporter, MIT family isoform 1 [Galdieria sulphuraria]GJD06807.1 Magnesium transport protein CorA [Galdieria sulphuraria]|eukprot:XP_005706339.1 metal ion (Mn2+/Co2+) transporter, MIT family isoform 2 [Galdieria sulphuraria]
MTSDLLENPFCITVCEFGETFFKVTNPSSVSELFRRHTSDQEGLRWIHTILSDLVDLEDTSSDILEQLSKVFNLHPLAIEDIRCSSTRPKIDKYGEMLFIVTHSPSVVSIEDEYELSLKELNILLMEKERTVLTFERSERNTTTAWISDVREKLASNGDHFSRNLSLVLYLIIDKLTDNFFPVLEHYGEKIEEIESMLMLENRTYLIRDINLLKRDIFILRRSTWPLREVLKKFLVLPEIHSDIKPYLQDCLDHVIQIIDILEVYRDSALGLVDIYLSGVSHNMQEIMKTLTIINTIFIPLTFMAGIYGMNFPRIPELHYGHGYTVFWLMVLLIVGLEIWIFRKRGWMGS